ncbi:TonB-dependent receptor [Tenacibaculum sp. 1B UA]|uniref:outer membrane beta-barrel family protein n=1 Tax=Tenacibaculum sp. 1B UA TaxID=2922252 RepID=UPI002A24D70A|nr:outer membrane beta-barrel family protein [Tenacibaculum sp. 1B UA]MDX8553577.1 TonB-dependent receptor [Tenacibaculum sp. 1B UA]
MKKQVLNMILLLMCTNIFSQITYKGVVVDTEKQPISLANVILYDSINEKLIDGVTTDDRGEFRLKVKEKTSFFIEISFLGFKTKKINVTTNDLGNIVLEEDTSLLKEVIITSKKQTLVRKNDRLVFNIDKTVAQELGSAVEVLRVTPNIVIRDDQLTMLGKSFVRVMVNSKMLPLTGDDLRGYLASINSSDIIRVEVITVPPSEFEAEGNGGVINIVLKKEKKDFWSAVARVSSTQRTLFSYGRSLALNYKKKNTYLTVNISNGLYLKRNIFRNNNFFTNETWRGNGPSEYEDEYLNYRLSFTQTLTNKWELGLGYSGTNSDIISSTDNKDLIYDLKDELKYSLLSDGVSNKDAKSHALNFYNTIKLDSLGKKISLDVDYYKSTSFKEGENKGERREQNMITPTFSNNTSIDYDFENISGKIDVSLPYNSIDIKLGGKVSFSQTNNDFKFYDSFDGTPVLDENQSNVFNYDEHIYAAYVSGTKKISEKFSAKAGLRVESTVTKSYSKSNNQSNENKYTKFFPTLYLTYKLKGNQSLSFNVSRRLNRPRFESLDPFKIVVNPFKTIQGNPFLQPSFITNTELIFNSKKNELKIYGQKITDRYEQISELDPVSKVVNYTYYNHLNIENYGITDTYIFDKLKWLTSYNTIDIGYSKMSSSIPETIGEQEGFNAFVQTQNYIKLNSKKTLSLGVNYYHVFAAKQNVSRHGGYGPLDLSLRLKLLKGDLNLVMYANDILKTSVTTVTGYYNNVKTTYNNYYDSRSLSFIVRYTFGNKNIRTKRDRSGNRDIQNRAQ